MIIEMEIPIGDNSYMKNGKVIRTEYLVAKKDDYRINKQLFIDEPEIGSHVSKVAKVGGSVKKVIDEEEFISLKVLKNILESKYKISIGANKLFIILNED